MMRCIVLVAIVCSLARYTEAVNECTVHDNCRYCRDGAVVVRDAQNPSKLVYGGGHCFLNSGDVCVDIYTHLPCSGDASACPADAMSNVVAEYLPPAWYQSCDDQKKKYVMGPAGCLDGADSIGSCAPQYWTQTTTTVTITTTQNSTTTTNSTTTSTTSTTLPAWTRIIHTDCPADGTRRSDYGPDNIVSRTDHLHEYSFYWNMIVYDINSKAGRALANRATRVKIVSNYTGWTITSKPNTFPIEDVRQWLEIGAGRAITSEDVADTWEIEPESSVGSISPKLVTGRTYSGSLGRYVAAFNGLNWIMNQCNWVYDSNRPCQQTELWIDAAVPSIQDLITGADVCTVMMHRPVYNWFECSSTGSSNPLACKGYMNNDHTCKDYCKYLGLTCYTAYPATEGDTTCAVQGTISCDYSGTGKVCGCEALDNALRTKTF